MHSDIEVHEDEEDDWRQTLSRQHLFSTPILTEISPGFLGLTSLKETFFRLSPSERASICYGMDVRPLKTKLSLIKIIFEDRYVSLENFAHSLIRAVLKLDDHHAKSALISMLISLATGVNPILNDEKMCEIIFRNPRVMEGCIEVQRPTPALRMAVLWAYENNKKSWVNLSAPAITSLGLDAKWQKSEEFLDILSHFKKLDSLHYTLWDPLNELPPLLYSFLPLLKPLKSLYLTFGPIDKMHVMSLLDHLPPKLEDLILFSALKEEELCEFIKIFFKKVPKSKLILASSIIQADQKQILRQLEVTLRQFAETLDISEDQLDLWFLSQVEQNAVRIEN